MDYEKIGAHLVKTAQAWGWTNDGEGAQEYVIRMARQVAMEDVMSHRHEVIKPFLLFVGEVYYARGGWCDLHSSYKTLELALDHAAIHVPADEYKWWHVVDSHTGQIVAHNHLEAHS